MNFSIVSKILIFFSLFQCTLSEQIGRELSSIVRLNSNESEKFYVTGYGTGFSVSKDGYIVTASHVTENADQVRVTMKNGRLNLENIDFASNNAQVAIANLIKITSYFQPTSEQVYLNFTKN
jgi:hypothetical protein